MSKLCFFVEAPEMWVGIASATASVFIALFVGMFPVVNNIITKRMEIRERQQAEMLKRQNAQAVPDAIIQSTEAERLLKLIADKVGCQRCKIWLFHNGGYYYTGAGRQRMSMVADWGGNKEDKIRFQDMPLNIFSRYLEPIIQEDYVHEKNEIAYSDALGMLNRSNWIVSSALFKLRDHTGIYWVGILELDWAEHNALSTENVEYIQQMLHSISVLISPKMLR